MAATLGTDRSGFGSSSPTSWQWELGQAICLSELQFPHLQMGLIMRAVMGMNWIFSLKVYIQHLTHSRSPIKFCFLAPPSFTVADGRSGEGGFEVGVKPGHPFPASAPFHPLDEK